MAHMKGRHSSPFLLLARHKSTLQSVDVVATILKQARIAMETITTSIGDFLLPSLFKLSLGKSLDYSLMPDKKDKYNSP